MTPVAILLLTASAVTHAGWNLLGKRQNPSSAFFLTASVIAALVLAPLLWIYRDALRLFPTAAWVLLGITGFCQAVYYSGLAGAYRRGDMSLAYPLARAMPVVFVAMVSLALGRREEIATLGLAGMLLVTIGCIILPLPDWRNLRLAHYRNACCLLALVAALGTAGYTLIDDTILRQLRGLPGNGLSNTELTLLFVELETLSTVLSLAAYALINPAERRWLARLSRPQLAPAAATGLMITVTYGLVLASMAYVSNVSYVAAFRQLSIPLGAALGVIVQRESRPEPKLVGIAIISLGLVLVAIG